MQSLIAIITALLGTVLVLSGAGALWGAALFRPRTDASGPGGDAGKDMMERALATMGRLGAPERLIGWGVVLLLISAVAADAITFGMTLTAGSQ